MRLLKTALVQTHCTADASDNRQRMAAYVREAAAAGAKLVVVQELHNTPYFCQVEDTDNFDYAEPIPGPSTEFYGSVARECAVVLVTSLFEKRAPGL